MTDHELLQTALDALKHLCLHTAAIRGYDGEQVQTAIDALKARLAQPEPVIYARKEGDLIVVDLPQVPRGNGGIYKDAPPKREWIDLSAAEVKILRRASLNDRQFAEMIQAKLRDKNS